MKCQSLHCTVSTTVRFCRDTAVKEGALSATTTYIKLALSGDRFTTFQVCSKQFKVLLRYKASNLVNSSLGSSKCWSKWHFCLLQ